MAALKIAVEINPTVIDIDATKLADYRAKFGGVNGAFSGTAVLAGAMFHYIHTRNADFKRTLDSIKPLTW